MKNVTLKTKTIKTAEGTIKISAWVKKKGVEMEWVFIGVYLSVAAALQAASTIEENNLI